MSYFSKVGLHAAGRLHQPCRYLTMSLKTIDLHAGGEPARVVIGGMPQVKGTTMAEKRVTLMNEMDHIRKLLLLEPRGYPCQNANIIFPSSNSEASFGYVILEQNQVYPMMSALLRCGMIAMPAGGTGTVSFQLESPGGLVPIKALCANGKVISITLRNVPSFLKHQQVVVEVPKLGRVAVDVVYSGMWYCVVDLSIESNRNISLPLITSNGKALCRIGEMIKVACREQYPVNHPNFDYPGCDILVFIGSPTECQTTGSHGKNTVVMSNGLLNWDNPDTWTGMLDRSPCGTGTSAILTKKYYEGKMKIGEKYVNESIIGTQFIGEIVEEVYVTNSSDKQSPIPAIITEITGSAHITQYCDVVLEDGDPCGYGYTVSDIWV